MTNTPLPNMLDTSFRGALKRLIHADRMKVFNAPVASHLELAAIMKRMDGNQAILFPSVMPVCAPVPIPVIGNILASQENCEAAFGVDFKTIRAFVGKALQEQIAPVLVEDAPVQARIIRDHIDLRTILPVLHHTPSDSGRFITAGIVIVRDPETGIYNASYHRLQLIGPNRTAIKLDYGRHLRLAFERAQARGEKLGIAICIGVDLALQFTAATMGSQMPEDADELAVAGGLSGRALRVCRAISLDLLVPAEAEIIIEAEILPGETADEGPFGEFVGYASPCAPAPVVEVKAVTMRDRPIYHAINGFGRETVMLRKYVLEASLLKVLQASVPIVRDVEMTAGGLHRFHAVIQVAKRQSSHDGFQRNAMMAAFGALKDLDMIIVVDDDIDIRDPIDVEYALATRFEASRDLILIPNARGHEYVRVSNGGIRTKTGIDATIPFEDKARFARCSFAPIELSSTKFSSDSTSAAHLLGL